MGDWKTWPFPPYRPVDPWRVAAIAIAAFTVAAFFIAA